MAKYRIDAETAMGAANQLARAINIEGKRASETDQDMATVRAQPYRDGRDRLRNAYTVKWSAYSPRGWPEVAIQGGDIWAGTIPTFEFVGGRWAVEAVDGMTIQITPVHRRS